MGQSGAKSRVARDFRSPALYRPTLVSYVIANQNAGREVNGIAGGTQVGGRVRYALTAFILLAIWLFMSGVYKPLVIGFAIASVLLVTLVVIRMDRVDGDHPEFHLNPLRFLKYFAWLLAEIAKANWAVTKLILAPGARLNQHMFFVPATQKSDVAQVTFANSITLTPGTITVETEPGRFLVHAVNYSEGDSAALADMDRRISACETI